jgi:hypothetical protein
VNYILIPLICELVIVLGAFASAACVILWWAS